MPNKNKSARERAMELMLRNANNGTKNTIRRDGSTKPGSTVSSNQTNTTTTSQSTSTSQSTNSSTAAQKSSQTAHATSQGGSQGTSYNDKFYHAAGRKYTNKRRVETTTPGSSGRGKTTTANSRRTTTPRHRVDDEVKSDRPSLVVGGAAKQWAGGHLSGIGTGLQSDLITLNSYRDAALNSALKEEEERRQNPGKRQSSTDKSSFERYDPNERFGTNTKDGVDLTNVDRSKYYDLSAKDSDSETYKKIISGTRNMISTGDELIDKGTADIEQAKEGLGSFGQFAVDTGAQMTQWGMDAMFSAIPAVGQAISMAGFMNRAGGMAASQARKEGWNPDQQYMYQFGSALAEGISELTFQSVGALRATYGKGMFSLSDKLVNKMSTSGIVQRLFKDTNIGKSLAVRLAQLGGGALEEGLEEVETDLVDPLLRYLIKKQTDPKAEFEGYDFKQMGYDFIMGATMGGLLGGASAVKGVKADLNIKNDDAFNEGYMQNLIKQASVQGRVNGAGKALTTNAELLAEQFQKQIDAGQEIQPAQIQMLEEALGEAQISNARAFERKGVAQRESAIKSGDLAVNTGTATEQAAYTRGTEEVETKSVERAKEKLGEDASPVTVGAVGRVLSGTATIDDHDVILQDAKAREVMADLTGEKLPVNNAKARDALETLTLANEIANENKVRTEAQASHAEEIAKELTSMNNRGGDLFKQNYEEAVSVIGSGEEYLDVFTRLYTDGTVKESNFEEAYKRIVLERGGSVAEFFTEPMARKAFNAGRVAIIAEEGKAVAKSKASKASEVGSGISFEGNAKSMISKRQAKLLEKFAQRTGVHIRIQETVYVKDKNGNIVKDENGEPVTANGMYKDGVITIAADADNKLITVAKHELTHHIRQTAPERYQELEDFVFKKWYNSDATAMENKVAKYQRIYDCTAEEAREEIIADASEAFFTDEAAIQEALSFSEKLGKAIHDGIRTMLDNFLDIQDTDKIKDKGYGEFLKDIDILRDAEQMWLKALDESANREKGTNEQTETQTETEAKKSLKARDESYMDAVKRKDWDKVRNLVDEAAREAGYDIHVYHSTNKDFTVFKGETNFLNDYFYFSPNKKWTRAFVREERYTKSKDIRTKEIFLKAKNILDASEEGDKTIPDWFDWFEEHGIKVTDKMRENHRGAATEDARTYPIPLWGLIQYDFKKGSEFETDYKTAFINAGYDGIHMPDTVRGRENIPGDTYVVFEPSQAKSADLVTRDDNRKVIPLSERFNEKNEDIRYSISETDSDGNTLSKGQQEYFKDSKARDKNGNLAVVYHTTDRGGFTIFDPAKSDDKRSLFFSSSYDVSQTYGEKGADKPMSFESMETSFNDVIKNLENTYGKKYLYDNVSVYKNNIYLDRATNLGKTSREQMQALMKGLQDGSIENKDYRVRFNLYNYDFGFMLPNQVVERVPRRGYYASYLNLKNPLIVDAKGSKWTAIKYNRREYTTRSLSEVAEREGHDGVIIRNVEDIGGRTPIKKGASKVSDIYVAFNSNQVKLTSNEKPTADPDIRYSRKEQDQTYLDAVNRGDMEKAQQMVDEEARKHGYETELYHGTKAQFNSFDINKSRYGNSGYGIYFGDRWKASEYGGEDKLRVYVKTDNLASSDKHNITPRMFQSAISQLGIDPKKTYKRYVDTATEYVNHQNDERLAFALQDWAKDPKYYGKQITRQAPSPGEILSVLQETFGYDGLDRMPRELVLWDNHLVKLADPVTYDDNGNVIPLSERFNEKSDDIRYSRKEDQDYMDAVNRGDMKTAQKMVDEAAKRHGLTSRLMHGTNSFGFTTVEYGKGDDHISFFATDNEEVASSYVRPMFDDDEPNTYVRSIGKPIKNRVSEQSPIGDIINALNKVRQSSYKVATKEIIKNETDEQFRYVLEDAKELDRYTLPNKVQDVIEKVANSKDPQEVISLMDSIKDVHDIYYNDMLFYKATAKLSGLKSDVDLLKRELQWTPDNIGYWNINGHKNFVSRADVYEEYLDETGLSGRGIYELYASTNNPLTVYCNGSTWDNIKTTGEMADDLGQTATTREIAKWAYDHGYGTVIFDYVRDTGKYGDRFTNPSTVYAFLEGGNNVIKSADPVTYDDNGNVIPLSERFNEKNEDIRYSRKDSEGNTLSEGQQEYFKDSKLRDENGNLYVMYHGTENEFNVFDFRQGGKNGIAEGYGIYLSNSREVTDVYGNRQIKSYVNMKRPASALESQTLTKAELRKLINATVEYEASEMLDDYDGDFEGAKRDTWISNYVNTYQMPMEKAIDEVIKTITNLNGNDMDIVQEIMVGMGIRDFDAASKFYDILTDTTGIDGFVTKWGDEDEMHNPETPIIAVAFRSNQIKKTDNLNPTENQDIRYSLQTEEKPLPKKGEIPASLKKWAEDVGLDKLTKKDIKAPIVVSVRDLRSYWYEFNGRSEEAEIVNKVMDSVGKSLTKMIGKYRYIDLSDALNASVTYRTDENGKPLSVILSCQVKNAEYEVNFDLTTICAKRAPLQKVLERFIKTEGKHMDTLYDELQLDEEGLYKLRLIMEQAGFEVSCIGCFVEQNRYQQQIQSKNVADDWNKALDEWAKKNGTEITEAFDFQNLDINSLPYTEIQKGFERYDELLKGESHNVEAKNRALIEAIPYLRKRLNPSDYASVNGQRAMMAIGTGKTNLYNLLKRGQGDSKQSVPFTAYNGEISLLPDVMKKKSLFDYLMGIGGARAQSASDFQIEYVYDYMQMVADLSARGLPMHMYTKVIELAELFGMTGIKINLSAMCDVDNSINSEYAGLKLKPGRKGNKLSDYDYNISNQSIDFEKAKALQRKEGYSKNIGIIMVVLSKQHMLKSLDDDDVRYIIGYHSSKMPPVVSRASNMGNATDYTKINKTTTLNKRGRALFNEAMKQAKGKTDLERYKDALRIFDDLIWNETQNLKPNKRPRRGNEYSKYLDGYKNNTADFDVYEDIKQTNDARATADNYIQYCMDNDLIPMYFPFAFHNNYYRCEVYDFNMYDRRTGEYAPMESVQNIYPGLDMTKGETDTKKLMARVSHIMSKQNEKNAEVAPMYDKVFNRAKSELAINVTGNDYMDMDGSGIPHNELEHRADVKEAKPSADSVAFDKFANTVSVQTNYKYSRKTPGSTETISQKNTIDRLEEKVAELKAEFKRTNLKTADPKQVRIQAGRFLKRHDANNSLHSEVVDTFNKIFGLYKEKGTDAFDEVYEIAQKTAVDVVNSISVIHDEGAEDYKAIKDYLKNTEIKVSDEMKRNITDYNDFRKHNFGRLKLVNGETSNIDNVYMELMEMFPGQFTEDYVNPADQLYHIVDVLDNYAPYYETLDGASEEMQDYVVEIASDIMETAYNLQTKKTFADKKYEEKVRAVKKAREEALASRKKALNRQKERYEEKIEALKQHNKDYKAETRERAEKKRRIKQISNVYKRLLEKLQTPTDTKHLPNDYEPVVSNVLKMFDFTTPGMEKWAERNGEPSKRYKYMLELRKQLDEMSKTDTGVEVDPDLLDLVDEIMADMEEGQRLVDMDSKTLEDISVLFRAFEHQMNTYNKAFDENNKKATSETAHSIFNDLDKIGDGKGKWKLGVMGRLLTSNFNPSDFFELLGGDVADLYNATRKGFDKYVDRLDNAKTFLQDRVDNKKADKWANHVATYKTSSGEEIELTDTQLMSLYCLNKREQAQGHIYGGGIVSAPLKVKNMKKLIPKELEKKRVIPSIEDVGRWFNTLTDEQKQVANDIQRYFVDEVSAWGNETSMKLYNYKKFNEPNYFPIQSSSDYRASNFDQRGEDPVLKNIGASKATVKNANNVIVIDDIFTVFSKHIAQMASYNAYVPAITDFQRVWNYTEGNDQDMVKARFERVYGRKAADYIENFFENLNGVYKANFDPTIFDKGLGLFKKAAVGGNIRVLVQQPTAIARSALLINPAYLTAAVPLATAHPKQAYRDMMEHCPIARWKTWGFYSSDITSASRDLKNIMIGKDALTDKIFMNMYGTADNVTWTVIFKACQLQVEAQNKGLEKGSDEYWEKVNDLASRVFDRTQVVDSPFHRSEIMKSQNGLTKMATAFMAEPTKTINMLNTELTKAMTELKNGHPQKALKVFARVSLVITANAAALALSQAMVDAMRHAGGDDDKDKGDYGDRFKNYWKANFTDNLNPFGMIPYIKDIKSIWDGYDVVRMDMTGVTKVINSIRYLQKYYEDPAGSKYTAQEEWTNLALTAFYAAGIPISNAKRDIEGLYVSIMEGTGHPEVFFDQARRKYQLNSKTQSSFIDMYFDALQRNDNDTATKIHTFLIKGGVSEEDISGRVNKQKRENKSDTEQQAYDRSMKILESSSIWKNASENNKEYYTGVINNLSVGVENKNTEYVTKLAKNGLTNEQVILYKLALKQADANNNNNGGYDKDEKAEALRMLMREYNLTEAQKNALQGK